MTINSPKGLSSTTPSLFQPSVVRLTGNEQANSITFNLVEANSFVDTNIDSTSSFKYDIPGAGLKSTQQLNIDWSKFENHTFFNSAQVKINVAFDKIQNQYPFDGTNKEVETYFDSLTGYEKYLYDNYPKNKGYLFFSGTNGEPFGGTYVTVKDMAGAAYPNLSIKKDGTTILNPGSKSVTIEYWLWIPPQANNNQIIFDKHSGSMGFMATLDSDVSALTANTTFHIVSSSIATSLTLQLEKNKWNHFAWVWNREPGFYNLYGYQNGTLVSSGSVPVEFGTFSANGDLLIGSGSALGSFVPGDTLSGSIDDFRIWHSVRDINQIKENQKKAIFAQNDLKLYYRFNEASGSNSALVIDASSNSLHGKLNTSAMLLNVRNLSTSSTSGTDPMDYELLEYCPILFPQHPEVKSYRTQLLSEAALFDAGNPNLITRLVPEHLLIEGQYDAALDTEQGQILTDLQSGTDPRSTKLGATQTFLLLLYTWAKFFDEMKLYTQAFSDINFVDYDNIDTVPSQFLQQLAASQGMSLPPLFTGASVDQFINANNLQTDISINQISLQQIQNQIWRRILINLKDVVRSKGTVHAVKSFIRSTGIDPDNTFRIREYGGPTKRNLTFVRDKRNEVASMLDFFEGGLITSSPLSASRIEPGFPELGPPGSNHLLTSGSWTYEGIYKFDLSIKNTQSVARMFSSGTISGNETKSLLVNCLAVTGSNGTNITMFARPNEDPNSPYLQITLDNVNVFDGDKWYISFGMTRNDDIQNVTSLVSSSYFLRAGKQNFGEITEIYSSSIFFNNNEPTFNNNFSLSGLSNSEGNYLQIGSSSIDTSSVFLNDSILIPDLARETDFKGKVSNIRFWSKSIRDNEWLEHIRNYKSEGVQNPLLNYNFNTISSGSFERLRIDASTDQPDTKSDLLGNLQIFDFSQNNLHFSGSDFLPDESIIVPEIFYYSYLSPKFDEASTTNKVRVRSFLDFENVQQTPWAEVAPVHDLLPNEQPTDSTKFTVDYSIVDALDQDIVTMFATFDLLDNIIGSPELMFSPDYPGLDQLREIYFNKLVDKLNIKNFFEFYKWFDTNIGTFITQLIPRKTKFNGTDFRIESHMLERPKVEYLTYEQYLGDDNRDSLRNVILLQLFIGNFVRY